MLDLDEAIKHAEEKAEELTIKSNELYEENYEESSRCQECANEHEQLAEWLKELKERREADNLCKTCKTCFHCAYDGDIPYCGLSRTEMYSNFGATCLQYKRSKTNGTSYNAIGDLIRRSALKQEFDKHCVGQCNECHYCGEGGDCTIIDNAPTVSFMISPDYVAELQNLNKELIKQLEEAKRPQGEWIPVSERLPEYSGLYLISVDDVVTVANFTGTYFIHTGGGRVGVYAWQPLPEPYKEGGAEK